MPEYPNVQFTFGGISQGTTICTNRRESRLIKSRRGSEGTRDSVMSIVSYVH